MSGLVAVAARNVGHIARLVALFGHVAVLSAVVACSTAALGAVFAKMALYFGVKKSSRVSSPPSLYNRAWEQRTFTTFAAFDIVQVGWLFAIRGPVAGFSTHVSACAHTKRMHMLDFDVLNNIPAVPARRFVYTGFRT